MQIIQFLYEHWILTTWFLALLAVGSLGRQGPNINIQLAKDWGKNGGQHEDIRHN